MGREYKVVISGSNRGSYLAYRLIDFIIESNIIKPIFIKPEQKVLPRYFDGLIISGGVDINPKLYGEKRDKSVKKIEPNRDELELRLLDIATKRDIPTLGICRGMQLINVYFKGTLYQDIYSLNLRYPHKNSIFPIKRVKVIKDTKLYRILNKSTIYVNSIHHQAVKRVGKNLRVNAYDKNGLIEGIESIDSSFLLGVQWHPEYIFYKSESKKIFTSFINAILRGSI